MVILDFNVKVTLKADVPRALRTPLSNLSMSLLSKNSSALNIVPYALA